MFNRISPADHYYVVTNIVINFLVTNIFVKLILKHVVFINYPTKFGEVYILANIAIFNSRLDLRHRRVHIIILLSSVGDK